MYEVRTEVLTSVKMGREAITEGRGRRRKKKKAGPDLRLDRIQVILSHGRAIPRADLGREQAW